MGVHGLWRLLDPAGRPVALDSLRGRTLAVDISIWLHRMVKGFRDSKGGSVPNAHLLGLFQRLCKLLYYGIRPVFVFDGSFPVLKRQTIINRQNKKSQMKSHADRVRRQLMDTVAKHMAIRNAGKKSPVKPVKSPVKAVGAADDEDMFKLPPRLEPEEASSESEEETKASLKRRYDLHTIDPQSDEFKKLSARERHDILTDLKDTRKDSSWGRIHELPKKLDNFSDYQMERLLKRRKVQVTLEETEKEIGGHYLTLNDLEILLNEEGIDTKMENVPTRRIASNQNAEYVLVKDVKKAYDQANKFEESKKEESKKIDDPVPSTSHVENKIYDLSREYDEELEAAIKLSMQASSDDSNEPKQLQEEPKQSRVEPQKPQIEPSNTCYNKTNMSSARAYMTEFSGLSEFEINKILSDGTNVGIDKNPTTSSSVDDIQVVNKHIADKLDTSIQQFIDSPVCLDNYEELKSDDEDISEVKLLPKESPLIESNPQVIESDDSSSDESFEEVPEKAKDDSDTDKSKALKDFVPENDMFGDIFKDESQLKLLDDVFIEQLNNLRQSDVLKSNGESKSSSEDDKIVIDDEKWKALKLEVIEEVQKALKLLKKESDDVIAVSDDECSLVEVFPQEDVASKDKLISIDTSPEPLADSNISKQPLPTLVLDKISSTDLENNESPKVAFTGISEEDMSALEEKLENQRDMLELEQNKLDRMGRNVSEEMTKDAQELLKLFGIPYIVAPTEAEAQCAFLESIKLTDGTITDDSDIWLFGGKTVYRDFFNQQKHVLQFLSENIERSFKMQREDLILLAMLVGSDYTMGVPGVGPVTALEILAAFPPNKAEIKPPYTSLLESMKKFRSWLSQSHSFSNSSLRNKLKNIVFSEEFPNSKVVEAYLLPEVETSKEMFGWGKPDVSSLRCYAKEKFGWSQDKTDEIILPVIKRMNLKNTQTIINSYFNTEFKIDSAAEKMSKRVKKAIQDFGNDGQPELEKSVEPADGDATTSKKAAPQKKERKKKETIPKKGKESIKNIPSIQDIIPQRQVDEANMLKNKLKAIEEFRKSRRGPGYVPKKRKVVRQPKEDAELSESGSD